MPTAALPLHDEIMAAQWRFRDTFLCTDAVALAAAYTPDGRLLPAGSDFVEGREAIADFWQSVFDAGVRDLTVDTLEVSGAGGTAYEMGAYILRDEDGETVDRGKYIVIWRCTDGIWCCHRHIWNTSQTG